MINQSLQSTLFLSVSLSVCLFVCLSLCECVHCIVFLYVQSEVKTRESLEQSLDSYKSLCEERQHQLQTTQQQVVGLTEQLGVSQQVNCVNDLQ